MSDAFMLSRELSSEETGLKRNLPQGTAVFRHKETVVSKTQVPRVETITVSTTRDSKPFEVPIEALRPINID